MSLLGTLLGGLDSTAFIIFFLFFLVTYYWLTKPQNMPPGPTGLPLLGNLVSIAMAGRKTSALLRKWHQEHGDVFTMRFLRKPLVIINSYKMLHEAFVKRSDAFSGRPNNLYVTRLLEKHSGLGVAMASGRVWKELRRLTLSSMKNFGMGRKALEPCVQDEARIVVENVKALQGKPLSLQPLLRKFAANIICTLSVGSRFDYDDNFLIDLMAAVHKAFSDESIMTTLGCLPVLSKFPPFNKAAENIVDGMRTVDTLLETTLKHHEDTYDPSEIRDFIDIYIKMREETQDTKLYSAKNLRRVIVDLLAAGVDTTSFTTFWIVLYLIAYPDVQKRCQQEADKVIGQSRLATMEDQKKMPYTMAVIAETMRVSSTTPVGLPHMSEKDTKLGAYDVPANTIVIANFHEIHHDPEIWPDPYAFKPERFLDKAGQFSVPKEGFYPFSVGPRVCIGESLARMELFVMLTTLVQSFTFSMPRGQKPNLEGHLGFLYSAIPQQVIATLR